jgi:hypothetical protein
MMKQLNIRGSKRRDLWRRVRKLMPDENAPNSGYQIAPWSIAYDTAGPTNCACEATKLSTVPVHQMAPPNHTASKRLDYMTAAEKLVQRRSAGFPRQRSTRQRDNPLLSAYTCRYFSRF